MADQPTLIDPVQEAAIVERQLTAPGFTSIREVRHARRAVRRKWIAGTRWPTDASLDELNQIKAIRQLSGKELLALRALEALQGGSRKDHNFAARLFKMMEEQNQKDDLASDASEALTDPSLPGAGSTVNNIQNNVVIAGESNATAELRGLINAALARKPSPGGNGHNGHSTNGNGHSTNGNGHAKENGV